MSLFQKSDLTVEEYLLKQTLCLLGMKKCPDEKIDKIAKNQDYQEVIKFLLEGSNQFLFAIPTSSENFSFSAEIPNLK